MLESNGERALTYRCSSQAEAVPFPPAPFGSVPFPQDGDDHGLYPPTLTESLAQPLVLQLTEGMGEGDSNPADVLRKFSELIDVREYLRGSADPVVRPERHAISAVEIHGNIRKIQ